MKKILLIMTMTMALGCSTFMPCTDGDCQNGTGTFEFSGDSHVPDGVYVGEWKNGRMNGKGTMTYTNGAKYVGDWDNNMKHGNGTMTYANGDKYVGDWEYDKSIWEDYEQKYMKWI